MVSVETALAVDPAVLDYALLPARSADTDVLIVYVVLDSTVTLDTVRARIGESLPDMADRCHWVAVLSLPTDVDGAVDVSALQKLPVLDYWLLDAWMETVLSNLAVDDAAALVEEVDEKPGFLHLSELLPASQHKPAGASRSEKPVNQTERESLASGESALLNGDPLCLAEDLPGNLPAFLRRAAKHFPHEERIIFIQQDGSEQRLTYAALLEKSEAILAGLRQASLQAGDKVILQLADNQDILCNFWACLLGGFVPVIMTPPLSYRDPGNDLDKLIHVYKHLQSPFILTNQAARTAINNFEQHCEGVLERLLFVESLQGHESDTSHYVADPDELAFFNLTSGSTGVPKCIGMSHHNLIMRALGANQANDHRDDDVILNWLPFDHIGSISDWHLRCVILGCHLVYAPKEYVLGQPLVWLQLIDCYRITHSWAPNFAYALILEALQEHREQQDWDLACVKALLSAGEAVFPATVADFLENLSPFGFPAHAIRPAFGMAEMGSGVAYYQARADRPLRFLNIHRASLSSEGGVVEAEAGESDGVVSFTSLGPPIPGVSLRIVDGHGELVPMGVVGHLHIKGDAVTSGYYKNPEANAKAFLDDGWFDTGDLAFLSEGELVIAGRAKEVIIINGANFANAEIEAVVEKVSGVAASFTAACGVWVPGSRTEEPAIFFSSLQTDEDELSRILREIEATLLKTLGFAPAYLIPLACEDIPKTAIGKIQRKQLAERLETGQYDTLLKQVDLLQGNARTVPDWFYQRTWRRKNAESSVVASATGLHVILADELGLAEALKIKLKQGGNACHLVRWGEVLAREQFVSNNTELVHVWHLWDYTTVTDGRVDADTLEQAQQRGVYSLLSLIQVLKQLVPDHAGRPVTGLSIVSSHAQAVFDNEPIASEKSPVLGLLKSMTAELPWLKCRHIDLPLSDVEANAACLLADYHCRDHEQEVAWRQGARWVMRLQKSSLQKQADKAVSLQTGGFYLLTGGLGGMGVEIARFLLEEYSARLLLVGRTPLSEAGYERQTKFQALQALPGEVEYQSIDVCDAAALELAVTATESCWQVPLMGVIHMAGMAHEQSLIEETQESVAAILRPKLAGALAVQKLLDKRPEAFSLFSSSAAGFLGGVAVAAYSASNVFLDYFAEQQQRLGFRSISLAWSMWDDVGMSQGSAVRSIVESKGYQLIGIQHGLRSLLMGLGHGRANLLVGLNGGKPDVRRYLSDISVNAQYVVIYHMPTDTVGRLDAGRVVQDRFGVISQAAFKSVPSIPRLADGKLDTESLNALLRSRRAKRKYVAPSTSVEKQLGEIWRQVLKQDRIGIHDNFFELGGDSITGTKLIVKLQARFERSFPFATLFNHPTIAALATQLDKDTSNNDGLVIRPVIDQAEMPLSLAQTQTWLKTWLLRQQLPDGFNDNIYSASRWFGKVDLEILEQSLLLLVQRQQLLCTGFHDRGGELVQVAVENISLPLTVVDISYLQGQAQNEELEWLLTQEENRVFDLTQAPLWHATVVQLTEESCVVFICFHHILGDGWSSRVLFEDLTSLYGDLLSGQTPSLEALPFQYADFADWQRGYFTFDRLKQRYRYWQERLANKSERLRLSIDKSGEPIRTRQLFHDGGRETFTLSPALTQRLRQLGQQHNLNIAVVLLSAYVCLLYAHSKQRDITVGMPVLGRNYSHSEALVGNFSSVSIVFVDLPAKSSFQNVLQQVKVAIQDSLENQDLSLRQVWNKLQLPWSPEQQHLFRTLFNFIPLSADKVSLSHVTIEPFNRTEKKIKVMRDLVMSMSDRGEDGISGSLEFRKDMFDADVIHEFVRYFLELLESIAEISDLKIDDVRVSA